MPAMRNDKNAWRALALLLALLLCAAPCALAEDMEIMEWAPKATETPEAEEAEEAVAAFSQVDSVITIYSFYGKACNMIYIDFLDCSTVPVVLETPGIHATTKWTPYDFPGEPDAILDVLNGGQGAWFENGYLADGTTYELFLLLPPDASIAGLQTIVIQVGAEIVTLKYHLRYVGDDSGEGTPWDGEYLQFEREPAGTNAAPAE